MRGFFYVSSIMILCAIAIGVRVSLRSDLFVARVVEIANQPEGSPLSAHEIRSLAAVPIGKVNLFDLDLEEIEKRILSNAWVRDVTLTKHFPQTLSIGVTFREPRALLQKKNGAMAYVDADARVFGKVSLQNYPDLPVLQGFEAEVGAIPSALRLISSWNGSQLSSISWDAERGYRALLSYPIGRTGVRARPMVELGHVIDDATPQQLERMAKVVNYLSQRSIAAHLIWADSGKKIVVRTSHGS